MLKNLLLIAVIGLVSGGIGFSIPLIFPSVVGGQTGNRQAPPPPPAFVPFGDVVVNLNEGRLNRYLRLSLTLQVSGQEQIAPTVTKQVEKNKAILTSWLLSYLSDMSMDDIRGAAGQNRLRREIQNHFNLVLCPDGHEAIQDVLFEEFNIQ